VPVQLLNTLGLTFPQPILKIAVKGTEMKRGDILEVLGDCPTFERHVRKWCERSGKPLLAVNEDGNGKMRIQIQF
jgi:tRNA 2-thiouridine synthesizing protein A